MEEIKKIVSPYERVDFFSKGRDTLFFLEFLAFGNALFTYDLKPAKSEANSGKVEQA